ncbi:SDR family NAD(P)-dependent oxidoreductase [Hymenobacter sp. BT186]|uniref:SDR family NAD(P)-dependent oxidoreductase n=1 Tax=Hymenobacter telluris TaxID=2816474 RepID=A0A939F114_9BACT|nr:SDR family NAD(P)-dependent oxidoreductase [Hymenobacter telluris]MBO0360155.1 SDR family NAD(P)-dependent oxidoreductase [Hymenobacter telluris]MBW3376182.1 SDR family NAD(P)-dependent oxidoreductase [Hymenobacter norwichensis]
MATKNIWFVTGASKGLGLTLVHHLLARGYAVAATSRNLEELKQAVPPSNGHFLPLHMDLGNEDSIRQAIATTISTLGGLDVVVNNAGYGQVGALEELSDQEARKNFDVNVFGLLHVLRHATPHLRQQGTGRVFNISSVGGFTGNFPGWGVYCATKFAVAGLTESYAAEVKDFGVQASVVYPGYFRTDFLTSGSLGTPQHPLPEYQAVRDSQAAHEQQINGNQPGDPEKAAALLVQTSEAEQQPLHLFLGADAYQMAEQKIAAVQQDMQQWQEVATATNFVAA